MGCYRIGESTDPDIYATALAAVLLTYPTDVVEAATDPVRGIPGQSKWMPSVAEVRHFCEELMAPRREEAKRAQERARSEATIAGEQQWATDEERARAVAKWEAQRDAMLGRRAAEEVRQEAERRLEDGSLYKAVRQPLTIGAELARKIEVMSLQPAPTPEETASATHVRAGRGL